MLVAPMGALALRQRCAFAFASGGLALAVMGSSCIPDANEGNCCTPVINADGTYGTDITCANVGPDEVQCLTDVPITEGVSSSCVPIPLTEVGHCNIGSCETLARGLTAGTRIEVASGTVFWQDSGQVDAISTAGGTPHSLVPSGIQTFTVDVSTLYWTSDPCSTEPPAPASSPASCHGGLASMPTAGGPTTILASAEATDVRVDSSGIYWSSQLGLCPSDEDAGLVSIETIDGSTYAVTSDGAYASGVSVLGPDGAVFTSSGDGGATLALCANTIDRISAAGGGAAVLTQSGYAPFALDALFVYWTGYDTGNTVIMRADKDGTNPSTLATLQNNRFIVNLVSDGKSVYWLDLSFDLDSRDGRVESVPVKGGTTTTIASWQPNPTGLAVDDKNVYWTNAGTKAHCDSDGSLMKAPIGGGAPVTLVSQEEGPMGVAVDDTSVYWITKGDARGGLVRKMTPK